VPTYAKDTAVTSDRSRSEIERTLTRYGATSFMYGWEQERALALVIKAKLEAVESGITVFDDEFMAHIVLPDGSTVGDFMKPQIEQVYLTGQMPPLLPASVS